MKPSIHCVPVSAGLEAIQKVLQEHGCVIVQKFLSPEQVMNINRDVDPHITKIHKSRGTYQEKYWVNMKRQGHMALISKTYREDVLNHPIIHGISETVFGKETGGDYWLATSAVLETSPGYAGQKLHREHDGIPICTAMGRECPEAMFNFLIALTPFTDENGATRVIPGSEKWDDYDYQPSIEESIPVEMDAGDAVLFGGKVLHGAGQNRSENFNRRALPIVTQSGYFTPVEASAFLPRNVVESMTPQAQKMIGWRSVKCQGIELWSLHMNDLGKQLGLKSEQPLSEDEIDKRWLSHY
ncbi:PhyH-domain-containing protein [Penicillium macrosclerotiorum]|uniref:PhyH-domain-containing protein n=1 Tax=Penicillium macrosclerotiorum TaxID=303699 RepID=UPI0025486FE9|nr:PhyH-domain-containing protein [Penicillium macrosclerotiorum]KAJ5673937.1 PhyH-domain-containing protein [Penicillium macrosclerotiorum]